MKTPQTKLRSGVKIFYIQCHESDSDGPSEDEQDTVRNNVKQQFENQTKGPLIRLRMKTTCIKDW
jgi:hypothetical protein